MRRLQLGQLYLTKSRDEVLSHDSCIATIRLRGHLMRRVVPEEVLKVLTDCEARRRNVAVGVDFGKDSCKLRLRRFCEMGIRCATSGWRLPLSSRPRSMTKHHLLPRFSHDPSSRPPPIVSYPFAAPVKHLHIACVCRPGRTKSVLRRTWERPALPRSTSVSTCCSIGRRS